MEAIMQRYKNLFIDAIPFMIVLALVTIAAMQLVDARQDMEQSRNQCYAQVGKEACENNVR